MMDGVTFQPPIGLAPVVGFQSTIGVAPSLGFQPPISTQAALGLSTPLLEYDSKRRESLSLLNNSGESLSALRLRMSETVRPSSDTFRATTSETWRPSTADLKTPDMAL